MRLPAAREGRQVGGDHHRGHVLGLAAWPIWSRVFTPSRSSMPISDSRVNTDVVELVAGAVEADHQPVADELVVAHALDVGDVLDPHLGQGAARPQQQREGEREAEAGGAGGAWAVITSRQASWRSLRGAVCGLMGQAACQAARAAFRGRAGGGTRQKLPGGTNRRARGGSDGPGDSASWAPRRSSQARPAAARAASRSRPIAPPRPAAAPRRDPPSCSAACSPCRRRRSEPPRDRAARRRGRDLLAALAALQRALLGAGADARSAGATRGARGRGAGGRPIRRCARRWRRSRCARRLSWRATAAPEGRGLNARRALPLGGAARTWL